VRTRRFILLILLVTLAFLGSAWLIVQPCLAAAFTGQVVGVIDGDTIDVLHNGQAERIRLNGIDCPEKKQAYGKKAKQFTSTLAYGKEVTIQVLRKDRHGRTVGDVVLTDGTNVSRELVKAGLAWWYRQYSKDANLGILEEDARQAKRGLWADPNPVPPWEVRQLKQSRTPLARGDLIPEPVEDPDTTAMPIIGNRNSHVYHRPDCPSYAATAPKNRMMFNSDAEAEAAGFHRAVNCA
jgi:micrococcal nuclease